MIRLATSQRSFDASVEFVHSEGARRTKREGDLRATTERRRKYGNWLIILETEDF